MQSIFEVWNDKCLSNISCNTFNCVSEGKHLDSCGVGELRESADVDNITDTNTQVVSSASIHADLTINSARTLFSCESNTNSLMLFLA